MGNYFTCCTIIIIILPLIKLGFKKNIKSVSPYKIPNRIIYIYIFLSSSPFKRDRSNFASIFNSSTYLVDEPFMEVIAKKSGFNFEIDILHGIVSTKF